MRAALEIDFAFLANYAEATPNGPMSAVGAGWESTGGPQELRGDLQSGGNDAVTQSREEIIGTLGRGGVFDITTTGRKSKQPHRIEIGYHVIDGRLYISGMPMPRRRSWLANLDIDPAFTVHLRKPAPRDVAATARIIETDAERRSLMPHIARNWGRKDVEMMVRQSPLIEVSIEPPS